MNRLPNLEIIGFTSIDSYYSRGSQFHHHKSVQWTSTLITPLQRTRLYKGTYIIIDSFCTIQSWMLPLVLMVFVIKVFFAIELNQISPFILIEFPVKNHHPDHGYNNSLVTGYNMGLSRMTRVSKFPYNFTNQNKLSEGL